MGSERRADLAQLAVLLGILLFVIAMLTGQLREEMGFPARYNSLLGFVPLIMILTGFGFGYFNAARLDRFAQIFFGFIYILFPLFLSWVATASIINEFDKDAPGLYFSGVPLEDSEVLWQTFLYWLDKFFEAFLLDITVLPGWPNSQIVATQHVEAISVQLVLQAYFYICAAYSLRILWLGVLKGEDLSKDEV